MHRWTWLRIAAILTAVYAAAHTAGMPWTPFTGTHEQPVIDAMQSVRFAAFGASRSYWDFYQGFGVAISALLFVQAVLLWQCAAIAKAGAADIGPLIAAQFVGFLLNAILATAIAVCLACALIWPRADLKAAA